jgi:hypothetical protein
VASLDIWGRSKLGLRFYGPFKVTARVDTVAYKMDLPVGTCLHDVFDIGLLKPHHGAPPTAPGMLPPIHHGRVCPQLAEVIKGRLAQGVQELLIRWTGQPVAEATWVELDMFRNELPSFELEDEQGREM